MSKWALDNVLYRVIHVILMPEKESKVQSDVLVVRKINKTIYTKFKERALEEHRNVGDALNQAMAEWLQKQDELEKPHIEKILSLNGIVKTDNAVRWSEEVDETLYGESA